MTELINNFFALEVPSMAFGFDINNYGHESELMYTLDIEEIEESITSDETLIVKKLPAATWSIVSTLKEITEDKAAEITPGRWSKYFENAPGPLFEDFADNIYRFDNAIESLLSLFKSKSLSTDKNYIILKKEI